MLLHPLAPIEDSFIASRKRVDAPIAPLDKNSPLHIDRPEHTRRFAI